MTLYLPVQESTVTHQTGSWVKQPWQPLSADLCRGCYKRTDHHTDTKTRRVTRRANTKQDVWNSHVHGDHQNKSTTLQSSYHDTKHGEGSTTQVGGGGDDGVGGRGRPPPPQKISGVPFFFLRTYKVVFY